MATTGSTWWWSLLSSCWLLCASASAQQVAAAGSADASDEGVARGLYQAGKSAYEQGRYEEALGFFEQAYEQSRRPRMLYNIGQAADRLRRDERALEAFRQFLQVLPDDPVRPEVEKRIAALERAVAERKQSDQSAAAAPVPVVTPEAAAESVEPPSSADAVDSAYTDPAVDADDDSVLTEWWLWTSVGVVVAGGVTALVLVLGQDDPEPRRPLAGDVGGVVQTLGRF